MKIYLNLIIFSPFILFILCNLVWKPIYPDCNMKWFVESLNQMHFQDVQLVAGGGGCASYSCIDHQNFNLFDYLIGIIQTKLCNTKLISNMGDFEVGA